MTRKTAAQRPDGNQGVSEPQNGLRARTARPSTVSAAALRLKLPYPTSVNRLYRVFNGRSIKSAEGRAYAQRVAGEVWFELRQRGGLPPPPYRLTIELWVPDRRKRDCDGPVKATMDALFAGLGMDDSAVAELHVYRLGPDRTNPRAEVTLESMEAA